MLDLATYTWLIGFLNYHGLLHAHLNEYTRKNVNQMIEVNKQFDEIIKGEQWTINRKL